MSKRILVLVAVVAIGALFVACQESGPPGAPSAASTRATAEKDDDDEQQYLADLWDSSRDVEFEVVLEATFDPKDGCDVTGVPASWLPQHPEHAFRLVVAPDAIDPDLGMVTITFAVPTLGSLVPEPGADQSMPIDYQASFVGVIDPPAELTFAYHPRLRPNCGGYCFFGLSRNEGWYSVDDPVWVAPDGDGVAKRGMPSPPPPQDPLDPWVACATGLQVPIADFTAGRPDRWEVVNGCCGRDDTPCDWPDLP